MANNAKKITVDQLSEVVTAMGTANDNRFVKKETGKGLSTNDFDNTAKNKLDGVEEGANNYTLPDATDSIKGGVTLSSATNSEDTDKAATPAAVKAAMDVANAKQSPATSLSGYGIQDAYTKTEIDAKLVAAYKPGGSIAPASVAAALLIADNEGKVYDLTDDLTLDATTAALFVDGAVGNVYPKGSNIAVINSGTDEAPAYKFDALPGFIDLSGYATTADVEVASAQDIQDIINGIYGE